MKLTSSKLFFGLLLLVVVFDFGLPHQNGFPGKYALYSILGNLLLVGLAMILSTILAKKEEDKTDE